MAQKRILTIEDDPDVATLLVILLTGLKVEVFTAGNGRQGIDLARSKKPDVILIDLHLPDISGLEVLKELQEIPELAATHRVVLTGQTTPHDVKEAGRLGVADFLVKSDFIAGHGLNRIGKLLLEPPAGSPSPNSPLSVLVIEDDPDIRSLLVTLLAAEGADTREAADGALAVQEVISSPPDLILLDLHLPKLDGLDVMRMVHAMAAGTSIPVLVMTGSPTVDSIKASRSLHALDYILKTELLSERGKERLRHALSTATRLRQNRLGTA